ncbi:MAG: F0F1 ATP synthase subunit B [Erysipelotrichaceae bacterium]|nr:F0F1 ATP synthase subunit B [Erysipelotrichaceae bacterium]
MDLNIDILTKLFPDLITMVAQLGATGLLLFGFKKYLWKPMTAYLEKRAEAEDSALRMADEANKLAQVNLAHSEMNLSETSVQVNTMIEQGKEEARRIKEKLLSDAKAEADGKLDAARREIEHEKLQLRKDIEKEIIDVALVAAKRLMEDKVDIDHDRLQVQQIIKDVRN